MNSADRYPYLFSDIEKLERVGVPRKAISPLGRRGASSKRYYRLAGDSRKLALITDCETVNSICRVGDLAHECLLRTPVVYRAYPSSGIIILEDAGDLHLRDLDTRHDEYSVAIHNCLNLLLQACRATPSDGCLPNGKDIFADWVTTYVTGFHLKFIDHGHSADRIKEECRRFERNLGPSVFLSLGDVSPDNIMIDGPIQDPASFVFIDIQDAILAPFGADIVSLLHDVRSPREAAKIDEWVPSQLPVPQEERLILDMQIFGLFRLLRIAGTFADLDEQLGKRRYLRYLPYVRRHLEDVLAVLDASELQRLLELEKWPGE